eukprot:3064213-Amphidinium_carterae.1
MVGGEGGRASCCRKVVTSGGLTLCPQDQTCRSVADCREDGSTSTTETDIMTSTEIDLSTEMDTMTSTEMTEMTWTESTTETFASSQSAPRQLSSAPRCAVILAALSLPRVVP